MDQNGTRRTPVEGCTTLNKVPIVTNAKYSKILKKYF